jgi:hypothetical protein
VFPPHPWTGIREFQGGKKPCEKICQNIHSLATFNHPFPNDRTEKLIEI